MTALVCQLNKAQVKPETHEKPVAMDTRPKLANSSSAAADMEIPLPTTDKRAAETVDDSAMEDGHKENKRARTFGGLEVCVLDDNHDEWLDELGWSDA